MICGKALTKRFGATIALDRFSLEVPDGSVFGLLGPNGAGKTTFLRLVMGFVLPSAGELDRGGVSPAQIGYLPERAFYPHRFTVHGYLTTLGRLANLKGTDLSQTVERLLLEVGLHEVAGRRLAACSRGMLQRMGLAQALLGDPSLLLLDEPAQGLDPAGQKFMREQIMALHQAGKTVLLSSHHLDEITRVCTHVAVLNRGRLVRSGSLDSLLAPRAQVIITVGQVPADLPLQLASLDPEIRLSDRRVILTGETTSRKAKVLQMLLDNGIDIRQLTEKHASLEEIYMEATGE
jgi:ABC-2 type transport system ATP-binding protein